MHAMSLGYQYYKCMSLEYKLLNVTNVSALVVIIQSQIENTLNRNHMHDIIPYPVLVL